MFGLPLDPTRVDGHEKACRPHSLTRLDDTSAPRLRQLMHLARRGLAVAQYAYAELPILWVIDPAGTLWLALEEVIDATSHAFVLPRLRGMTAAPEHRRLGHPALLGGGKGRIGGEILFDMGDQPPCWYITNASGRYGLRGGREYIHLDNAAKIFSDHGIEVVPSFIEPRRGSP